MATVRRTRVIERAKINSEFKKLFSFRLKERLMKDFEKSAKGEQLTVTGLLEALIEEYLKQEKAHKG